jgi:hypothetical protein
MKTWSANLKITSTMSSCRIQEDNYGGQEQCLIEKKLPGCVPMDGDCAYAMPVMFESLSESSFEHKYWKRKGAEPDAECPACPKQCGKNNGLPIPYSAKSVNLGRGSFRPTVLFSESMLIHETELES